MNEQAKPLTLGRTVGRVLAVLLILAFLAFVSAFVFLGATVACE